MQTRFTAATTGTFQNSEVIMTTSELIGRSKTSEFLLPSRGQLQQRRWMGGAALLMFLQILLTPAWAANLYWDSNGTTNGAGTTPTGNWGTNDYWSASSLGTATTAAWTSGETAVFSAGTDATGIFTVTLGAAQTAAGLTFEEGVVTLTGMDLNIAAPGTVICATTGIVDSVVTGSAGLTKLGNGELVLKKANTFTGNLTNRAGVLTVEHPQAASSGLIVLNPTAPLSLRGTVDVTIANDISLLASSSIGLVAEANKTLTLSGVISGSRGFDATGVGTLVLSGPSPNTFTGPLAISQGTVVVAKDGALGSIANGTTVNSGGALAFDNGVDYLTTETLTVSGTGVSGTGAIRSLTGDNDFSGSVALATDASVGVNSGSLLTLVGAVTGTSRSLTKVGPGTLDLISSGNTYLNTYVTEGTLGVWGGTADAGTGLVTVSAGARLEGTGNAPGGVNLSGTIAPGASPGYFASGSQTWNGGGSYEWQVADFGGDYDYLDVTGNLTVNATVGSPFTMKVISLNPFTYDPDAAASFDNTMEIDRVILSTTTGITGFDPTKFVLNTNDFSNDQGGGRFVILTSGNDLVLRFDPPPVITNCTDITQSNDPTFCGATVSFGILASDNQPGVTYSYKTNGLTISSPCYFPVGTNTVDATAADSVGNTDTCSFTVTVNDTEVPVVVTKNITVQLDSSGNASIVGADVNDGSTDNCGIASLSVSPDTFDCGDVGANPVTLTVTDIHGNMNTAGATVTVEDSVKPLVVAQNITVYLDATGNVSITGAQVDNGSSDACGIATLSVSPDSFTCGEVGANAVVLTATDNNGNSDTANATVTVLDTNAPVVLTQDITVQLDNTGNVSITPGQVDNGSSDACGIATSSVDPSAFDCSDVGPNVVQLVVTDVNGNSATNTATVTVEDNVAPDLVVNPVSVNLDAAGEYTLTVTDIDDITDTSSDACGIATKTVSPNFFTFCNVGGNSVEVIITDVNGNATTNTTTVTVVAPGAPSVVYVDDDYGTGCASVTWPAAGGTGTYYVGYNAFKTLQAAVVAVGFGGSIEAANGTYTLSTTLYISKSLTLSGESEGGVNIDMTACGTSWGIAVQTNNCTLSNFTILPPISLPNNGGYAIHATPADPVTVASSKIQNLTLANITTANGHRTPFDLHGVDGGLLDGLTATGFIRGNGIQLTACDNIVVRNCTTSGNAWGGLAVYTSTYLQDGSSNISIEASCSFSETPAIYLQPGAYTITGVTLGDPYYTIDFGGGNLSYANSEAEALAYAAAALYAGYPSTITAPDTTPIPFDVDKDLVQVDDSWVGNPNGTPVLVAGTNYTIGFNAFATIQNGVTAVDASGTVNTLDGNYVELVTINKALTLQSDTALGAHLEAPVAATSAALITVDASDVTVSGFDLLVNQPDATAGVYMDSTGGDPDTNLTVQNCQLKISGAYSNNAATSYIGFDTSSTAIAVKGLGGFPTVYVLNNQILPDSIVAPTAMFDRAIFLREGNGTIAGNTVYGDAHDLAAQFVSNGALTVTNNQFLGKGGRDTKGAQVDFTEPNATGSILLADNTITPFGPATPSGSSHVRSVMIKNNASGAPVVIENNQFTEVQEVAILAGNSKNTSIKDNTFTPKAGDSSFVHVQIGNKVATGGVLAPVQMNAVIQGNLFGESTVAGGRAIEFLNHNATGATFGTITIGGAGVLANTFEPGLDRFIHLDDEVQANSTASSRPYYNIYGATVMAKFGVNLDATGNLFDVGSGPADPSTMSTADLFALEDKIYHAPDVAALGLVRVKVDNVYVTSTSGSIQRGIDGATAGDTVNVGPGSFTASLDINKPLTLLAPDGYAATTITGTSTTAVAINANNVTLQGFTVRNPSGKRGVYATNRNGLLLTENRIVEVGTSDPTTSGTNIGIGIESTSSGVDDVQIVSNVISNLTGGNFKSCDAIFVGSSTGASNITSLVIASNLITQITSSTNAFASGGRGAYGMILNHASGVGANTGQTIAPLILNNEITGLEGLWSHAIGLEGDTPSALVSGNLIANIIDYKSPGDPDAVGVMVESNPSAASVTITGNSFSNVWLGVRNVTTFTVTAETNWWGAVDGPTSPANVVGTGVAVSANVDFSPWLGDGTDTSPAIGFQPNLTPLIYAPASLAFATQPVGAALGSPLSTQPVVNVLDEISQVATQFNGSVTIALYDNPGSGVLTGTLSVNAVAGVATFTDLAVTVGGGENFTLEATSASPITAAVSDPFDITNPAPSIATLDPAGAVTGSGAVNVTIAGANFVPTSVARFDGADRVTTYVSATELTVALIASDTDTGGFYDIDVVNPPAGGGTSGTLPFTVGDQPSVVYVDDNYTVGSAGGHVWAFDAFTNINQAITAVTNGGTVNVAAGTYNENVVANKPVILLGANNGVAGCTGRVAESVINGGTGFAVDITSDGVTLNGFQLSGAKGVQDDGYESVSILNNLVTTTDVGVQLQNIAPTALATVTVQDNCVDMIGQIGTAGPSAGIAVAAVGGDISPVIKDNNVSDAFTAYVLYAGNSAEPTKIEGGTITGVMQGVSVLNLDPVTFSIPAPSTFIVDGVVASGFVGDWPALPSINFHAGVYVFTGGSDTGATVVGTVTNVTVTGTGKPQQDSAGLSFADFSTGVGPRQTITVVDSVISNNANRGLNTRGSNAVVTVTASTFSDNGNDPFGPSGNHGYGLVARESASLNVSECFIANPASVTGGYSVSALAAHTGAQVAAFGNSVLNGAWGTAYLGNVDGGSSLLDASGNWWGETSDSIIAGLITGSADFTPYLADGTDADGGTSGFQGDFSSLKVTALKAQTGATGRVQEGVDLIEDGSLTGGDRLVDVRAGTYPETVDVYAPVRILGPNQSINPNGGSRVTEAILEAISWYSLYVESSDVEVAGLSFDGIATSDYAIFAYTTNGAGNLVLSNNIVADYVTFGFVGWVESGPSSSGNLVSQNLFDAAGERAVVPLWNYYTDVKDNVITNSPIGIYAENANSASGSPSVVWSGNQIAATRAGIWYNLAYGSATPLTITNNFIEALESAGTRFSGVWLTSIGGSINPVIGDNLITIPLGGITPLAVGYDCWNDTTTAGIAISGGSVSDCDYGVWVNNFDGYPTSTGSNGGSTAATVSGLNINAATLAGVYVKDNPSNSNGATVKATVTGNTTIVGSPIGVLVEGPDASAIVSNNAASITGNGVGIDVDAGKASIVNNNLTGNSIAGIRASNGATVDAGDCTGSDITGLGSSAGGNDLTGYLSVVPKAIINNASTVYADNNAYGAIAGQDIAALAFTGVVTYSQSGGLLATPPTDVTVECLGEVPVGITTRADYVTYGGMVSADPVSSITSSDGPLTPGPYNGTIARTYTLTDICGQIANVIQTITVSNTVNPAVVYIDDSYSAYPYGTTVTWPATGGSGSYVLGCDAFTNIQAGVDRVMAGGTVNVAAGTYNEDVLVNKTVNLLGAGAGNSVAVSPITGTGPTFRLNANNVVLDGFTVTRAGNDPVNWNALDASPGIAIQGPTLNGIIVRNCLITGNRTGIDINGSSGHTIRNNVIENNHTGMIMRNQTDNLVVVENRISDNRTVGVLFLDASGGSNSPLQQAANCQFSNNDISGNWYGQVVDRQSGGSLPAPGTNLKNFSGNWLGTTTPVVSTANSAEPAYAVLIPVVFGGTATPPGGQPDICGAASANIDYTPWLDVGTDTDVSTGYGTYGFQGDFSTLHINASSAQVGSTGRIQEGIDLVTTSTVYVHSGTYTEGPQILVNKDVSLIGDGLATTTVAPAGNTTVGGNLPSEAWVYVEPGQTASISGITFDGAGKQIHHAIQSRGDLTLASCDIKNISYSLYYGRAVVLYSGVSTITNCSFSNIERIGVHVRGAVTTPAPVATIVDCTYTGKGVGTWLDYAVEVGGGGQAVISNLTATACLGLAGDGSTSAGVLATTYFAPNTALTLLDSSLTGNTYGVAIGYDSADATKVLLQGNDLTGNTAAGVQITGAALVDMGQLPPGSNFTGLGISTGGNDLSGYGFDETDPWAIDASDTVAGAQVLAYNNDFGAAITDDINSLITDGFDASGPVAAAFSQTGDLTAVAPTNVTVECAGDIPAAITNLADYISAGGVVSASPVTISSVDVNYGGFPVGDGTVTRTYTLTDAYSRTTNVVQTITVDDTTPPTITAPANVMVNNDSGLCTASGVSLGSPTYGDNCGVDTVGNDAPLLFPVGVTPVIWTVTDNSGLTAMATQTVTVVDTEVPVIGALTADQGGDVLNCAATILQGVVTITVQASDQCTLPAPIITLSNGIVGEVATNISELAGVYTYEWPVTASTLNGTWDVTVAAYDLDNVATTNFTLCVNKSQITGQIELQGFLGTGAGVNHSRLVVFKATTNSPTVTNVVATWSMTLTNVSGSTFNYTLTGVPDGVTGLSAKTAWNLRRRIPMTLDVDNQAVVNFVGANIVRGGDIAPTTRDNAVQLQDYLTLLTYWFTTNPVADMDGNGQVTSGDYNILSINWYTTGDPE